MKNFIHDDVAALENKIAAFRNKEKIVFSNYYGLPKNGDCDFIQEKKTIIIRVKEYHFYRLFFLSSDIQELKKVLYDLKEDEYVINIPTRTSIEDRFQLFFESGFALIGVYDRYYNNSIQSAYDKICKFTEKIVINDSYDIAQVPEESEVFEIWSLLNDTFSLYIDHIPNCDELRLMIQQKHCFVNRVNGKVCGVNFFTPTRHVLYDNCRVDNSGLGPFLSKNMVRYALDNGIKTINYWVNRDNKMVVKYHRLMGAIADGLVDYSFLKK